MTKTGSLPNISLLKWRALYILVCLFTIYILLKNIGYFTKSFELHGIGHNGASGGVHAGLPTLLPLALSPLPLGNITPTGWLRDQLDLMANGLAGHEFEFHKFVRQSSWLGGDQEYSGLGEGFPYWFNGLVPLAYLLKNDRLKEQVDTALTIVMKSQAADGWIGPEKGRARNLWARFPFLLGLVQLMEANQTYVPDGLQRLNRFVSIAHSMLQEDYSGYRYHPTDTISQYNSQYAQVRSADFMLSLMWLYEHHPGSMSRPILEMLHFLKDGNEHDWEEWYKEGAYLKGDLSLVPEQIILDHRPFLHGVNVAQGLKTPAVIRRFLKSDELLNTAERALNWTFTYHGSASGTVLADELMSGLQPYVGSELCTTVELMFSLSYLYSATAVARYADQLELAAFNALPGTMTGDWWAHQYVTQPNQPVSKKLSSAPFTNVNEWGQTFGLEPHYPCCTINHIQGFPKFASATFMTLGENGLVHALLGPSSATAYLSSRRVSVSCNTQYPFSDLLEYEVSAADAFDFYVRVPEWSVSDASFIQIIGSIPHKLNPDKKSGLHKIRLPPGKTKLKYVTSSAIRVVERANSTVAIYKGALLYVLDVGVKGTSSMPINYKTKDFYPQSYAPSQCHDWTLVNATAWNIAIDISTLSYGERLYDEQLSNPIFSSDASLNSITARACEIAWPLHTSGVPDVVPPAESRQCLGDSYKVKLIPYGAAKLHMTDLPTVKLT